MNIQEMHVMFRQYAQQMGMQNIRVVLPEQIDLLINTSINDIVNQLVRSSVGVVNDRIVTDNSKIQQINSLRTLYKVQDIDITPNSSYKSISVFYEVTVETDDTDSLDVSNRVLLVRINNLDAEIAIPKLRNKTDCVRFNNKIRQQFKEYMTYFSVDTIVNVEDEIAIVTITSTDKDSPISILSIGEALDTDSEERKKEILKHKEELAELKDETDSVFLFNKNSAYSGKLEGTNFPTNYLYVIDFSISYRQAKLGYNEIGLDYLYDENSFISNIFPVRLIDDVFLADTINDFQLAPKLRSPIIVNHDNSFDLYFPKFIKSNIGYTLENKLLPYKLRFAYIAKPAIVKYEQDIIGEDVDCDLPEHLHVDIVKHAVELYMQAIGRGNPQPREEQANTGQTTSVQQGQQ